ncbi:hypothetical protein KFK09_019479 [Dendrobium nobile]|uniref:Uncharacterized protein n=1 Tax=Dendrobium nobile TaxID=94219 RepID=A0A8T3AQD0_DENNO|nr:hypothetical protein KFK09_019479 [Dendrobium nobile]
MDLRDLADEALEMQRVKGSSCGYSRSHKREGHRRRWSRLAREEVGRSLSLPLSLSGPKTWLTNREGADVVRWRSQAMASRSWV